MGLTYGRIDLNLTKTKDGYYIAKDVKIYAFLKNNSDHYILGHLMFILQGKRFKWFGIKEIVVKGSANKEEVIEYSGQVYLANRLEDFVIMGGTSASGNILDKIPEAPGAMAIRPDSEANECDINPKHPVFSGVFADSILAFDIPIDRLKKLSSEAVFRPIPKKPKPILLP